MTPHLLLSVMAFATPGDLALPTTLSHPAIRMFPATAAPTQGQRPNVQLLLGVEPYATNVDDLTIQAQVAPAISPTGQATGNIQDVDLIVDGVVLQTMSNVPPLHEPTLVTFRLDLSAYSEGSFQLEVRAYQGDRQAGLFGSSGSFELIVDRTPPALELTWPPHEVFGTDLATVDVEGTVADDLSGVAAVSITGDAGTMQLSSPGFLVEMPLDVEVSTADPIRENLFTLRATDAAGNTVEQTLQVDHTPLSTIIPFPDKDLLVGNDTRLALNSGFVVFASGVSMDLRHAIIESHGGKVAGHLDSLDTALAVFPDCGTLSELQQILTGLSAEPNVLDVQLDYALRPTQAVLDNEIVGSGLNQPAMAYGNIRANEAAHWIESNLAPEQIHPVTVAIIDTGLDPTAGLADEFDGMLYIDCTSTIDPSKPFSTPSDLPSFHGTNSASLVAGRNNTEGNNGVATILNGGPRVDVIVYGVGVLLADGSEVLDPHAVALALDDIAERSAIDVVLLNAETMTDPLSSAADDGLFQAAVEGRKDVFWVFPAGNGQKELDPPGCQTFCEVEVLASLAARWFHVISVAAHAPDSDHLLGFSNYDDENVVVELSAPGTTVLAAPGADCLGFVTPPPGYGCFAGTSAAAALTAGAAALVKAASGQSAVRVGSILTDNGRMIPAGNPHPGLDVLAALEAAFAELPPATLLLEVEGKGYEGVKGRDATQLAPGKWAPFGLREFEFNYVPYPLWPDHHVDQVEIRTDSPLVEVAFNDKDDDDPFDYRVEGTALPPGTILGSIGGESEGGCVLSAPLPYEGTYVLTGFAFDYGGEDHHIKAMEIRFVDNSPNGTRVQVCYHDRNSDDPYTWRVDYAVVPDEAIAFVGETGQQTAELENENFNKQEVTPPVSFYWTQGLIRGFRFEYLDPDHHLAWFGVRVGPYGIRVLWGDKNKDDDFRWSVEYAVLGP